MESGRSAQLYGRLDPGGLPLVGRSPRTLRFWKTPNVIAMPPSQALHFIQAFSDAFIPSSRTSCWPRLKNNFQDDTLRFLQGVRIQGNRVLLPKLGRGKRGGFRGSHLRHASQGFLGNVRQEGDWPVDRPEPNYIARWGGPSKPPCRGGFKPPSAAPVKSWGRERDGKGGA